MRGRHRAWPWLIAVALLATLAACGKKAGLEPPDDTKGTYTYPQQYPSPESVLPGDTESNKARERPPPHAAGLSPFPTDRRTTTTYQSGAPQ